MWMNGLLRWLSWMRPLRMASGQGRAGTLEVRWEKGRKVLNSDHANQSFGSLHRVWQRVLAHIRTRQLAPQRVLVLGLGAGSAVHVLRNELGITAPITAVEWDPVVVDLGREHFGLDKHPDVTLLVADAVVQVQVIAGRFDLVLVDLFDDLDLARGVDTLGFAHGLRDRCAESGIVCFNTVSYDDGSEARCQKVLANLVKVFHYVEEYRTEGLNRVFISS